MTETQTVTIAMLKLLFLLHFAFIAASNNLNYAYDLDMNIHNHNNLIFMTSLFLAVVNHSSSKSAGLAIFITTFCLIFDTASKISQFGRSRLDFPTVNSALRPVTLLILCQLLRICDKSRIFDAFDDVIQVVKVTKQPDKVSRAVGSVKILLTLNLVLSCWVWLMHGHLVDEFQRSYSYYDTAFMITLLIALENKDNLGGIALAIQIGLVCFILDCAYGLYILISDFSTIEGYFGFLSATIRAVIVVRLISVDYVGISKELDISNLIPMLRGGKSPEMDIKENDSTTVSSTVKVVLEKDENIPGIHNPLN